jgi:hypothetical protein
MNAAANKSASPNNPPVASRWLPIGLDLNDYADDSQRGAALGEQKKKIELPAARVRLTLALREDSPAGAYRISVVDAFSRAVTPLLRRKSNGRVLLVQLDLRGLEQSAHRLRIDHDDYPDEYLIRVARTQR